MNTKIEIGMASLKHLAAHFVGNKIREEGLTLSARELGVSEDVAGIILHSYLGGITRSGKPYEFFHESDNALNEVNVFAAEIFADEANFLSGSKKIAKHLYSRSTHPKISGGDFLVTLFDGVAINGIEGRAIGLFKIETKEKFLSIESDQDSLVLTSHEGIDPKDLQKGALIVEGNKQIFALERGQSNATYWINEFLKIRPFATPKSTASYVGQIVKKTIAEIDDPQDVEKYKTDFEAMLMAENAKLDQLSSLNERFVGKEKSLQISDAVTEKTGLFLSPDSEIETKLASRAAKNAFRKITISYGVDLLLSGKSSTRDIRKEYSKENRLITIYIKLGEE